MNAEEKKHLKKQVYKQDPWRMFRIISEFVDGFEKMASLGPSVAFFGSARTTEFGKIYYDLAVDIAKKLAEKGFSIITGGSYGIMEAANKGGRLGKGRSCGLCIDLPSEEEANNYIDSKFLFRFRYFFVRKVMFVKYAQAFIVLPGGFGTLDELFEALTLIQTKKIRSFPVVLVGKEYWQGLIDWLKNTVIKKGNLDQDHLNIFKLTDDVDEVVKIVREHYEKSQESQNFS